MFTNEIKGRHQLFMNYFKLMTFMLSDEQCTHYTRKHSHFDLNCYFNIVKFDK